MKVGKVYTIKWPVANTDDAVCSGSEPATPKIASWAVRSSILPFIYQSVTVCSAPMTT